MQDHYIVEYGCNYGTDTRLQELGILSFVHESNSSDGITIVAGKRRRNKKLTSNAEDFSWYHIGPFVIFIWGGGCMICRSEA